MGSDSRCIWLLPHEPVQLGEVALRDYVHLLETGRLGFGDVSVVSSLQIACPRFVHIAMKAQAQQLEDICNCIVTIGKSLSKMAEVRLILTPGKGTAVPSNNGVGSSAKAARLLAKPW